MNQPRKLYSEESSDVIRLLSSVYSRHSVLDMGGEDLANMIISGNYTSCGLFDNGKLEAHAGFYRFSNYALMNALVVSPDSRFKGLGKKIFDARLRMIVATPGVDFIVGYSMAQHLGSQRLYGHNFHPIGLDINYPDIYTNIDTVYNRGQSGNAEIVLCQNITGVNYETPIKLPDNYKGISDILLKRLGLTPKYISEAVDNDSIFLGYHPSADGQLFAAASIDSDNRLDFSKIQAFTLESKDLVSRIKAQYERIP